MICISIAQESRRLALVDIYNAAPQCDLMEIRLDFFERAADLNELLADKRKPVILSCRRKQDGGNWDGPEEERLAVLRQCILNKHADYVEIEEDVADHIKLVPGGAKRVISFTSLEKTPTDIADIYARCQNKSPDVIKLTTLARTPEEAWPLVQIQGKAPVPTVVVGLGKSGIMLTVLGRKINAPWTYAALEKGMEAYPDQPTVSDLREVYRYDSIGKGTRLVGVTGFGPQEYATVAALNAAFVHHNLPIRCWPCGVGSVRLFRKVADNVKMQGVVVDEANRRELFEMATERDEAAEASGLVDMLLHKNDAWIGHDTYFPALATALENSLRSRYKSEHPLTGRIVAIVGTNDLARRVAFQMKARGCGVIIVSYDKEEAHELAQHVGCRMLQMEALYTTMHDVVIVADDERTKAKSRTGLSAVGMRSGVTLLDLTDPLLPTPLAQACAGRGLIVVQPRDVWLARVQHHAEVLAGKAVPRDIIAAAVPWLMEAQ
jgi:3-dehydroquinate dehydratase/shikimate dehydrogenase